MLVGLSDSALNHANNFWSAAEELHMSAEAARCGIQAVSSSVRLNIYVGFFSPAELSLEVC
jgi:hypothetical protein